MRSLEERLGRADRLGRKRRQLRGRRALGAALRKSSMSLPALNTSRVPRITIARTAASAPASRDASAIAAYIAAVIAFFFAGRSIAISSTPGLRCVLMSMAVLHLARAV